jgi:predicted dehydrogenase
VGSTLLYNKGYCGTIHVNWSDASYRKPTNIVKIFGTKGRIVADKHAYKVFLREAAPEHGFNEGWNTRYITEFAESVRFYVRGNEFTRQLDYFVDCIGNKVLDNIASFAEAQKTDSVMEEITRDTLRSHDDLAEFVPTQSDRKRSSSFLSKILK